MLKPIVHFDQAIEDPEAFAKRWMQDASALDDLGIKAGDVVAYMLHNEPLMVELMIAARHIGAHYCLVNWHFKAAEVRHILEDSKARVLIVHANLVGQIEGGVPEGVRVLLATPAAATRRAFGLGEEAVAARGFERWEAFRDLLPRPPVAVARPGSMMAYTSGTTGLPKGVRRNAPTPEQVGHLVRACAIAMGIVPGMRALVSAPLYHSAPATYVVQSAVCDAEIWLEPRFEAEATLKLIAAEKITHAYLVPTMYRRLLQLPDDVKRRYDVSSLRFVASTGAPCPMTVKRDMIAWFGPVIHESYAASELGYITHIDSEESMRKPGSAGKAMADASVTILTEEGSEAPLGVVGLIYARHHGMPDFTYSGNDEARRKLELNRLWTLGDMGYLDEDGYLYVVDRKADMVISGGVNIYPAEIEATLATMTGVADSAVFGIPCDEFGESLLAVVQPLAGASLDPESVQSFLRERIAGFKVPRQVLFVDQLPREDTGKIFKRKLRDPYWSGVGRRV